MPSECKAGCVFSIKVSKRKYRKYVYHNKYGEKSFGRKIRNLLEQSTSTIIRDAHKYFVENGISYDELAAELKDDFRKNTVFLQ